MTKYILHGGFTRWDNELNRTFYEEIVRDVPEGGTVLLVYFASENEGDEKKNKEDTESILRAAGGKHLTAELANRTDFLEQLDRADAVYIRGGSTERLLEALRAYPDFASRLQGKTVAGSSAGAYALARISPPHHDGGMHEGLGILPLRVVCHYESPELPPDPKELAQLEGMLPELDIVKLHDCEWKVIEVK
jgi:peptidase E